MKTPRFVQIVDYIPDILLDIRYATSNNVMGYPLYESATCLVHEEAAHQLACIQKTLRKKRLALKIFDGYRPLFVQQIFWDAIQDERYVSNPAKNKGRHTRGTAVDVTLIDPQGKELLMPTAFDELNERAHSDATAGISQEAIKNRALLKEVMEAHNFQQFPTEWWHFDLIGWENDELYPACDLSFREIL